MKRQMGFTLVEIAIVMVIIGLLLGGVLKGQEIITNAKIKNLENDFTGVTAAIYSYQDRYRALPGDDARADTRFAVARGNGNGQIEGAFNAAPTDTTAESILFWTHLRAAGLIAGNVTTPGQPSHAFNGITGVSSVTLPSPITIPGLYVGFTSIPNTIAQVIEARTDDGQSSSGNIQGTGGTSDTYSEPKRVLYNLFFSL